MNEALSWEWVDDLGQLEQLLPHWLSAERVYLDTEFMRTDTFFPKLALVQISDGENIFLLDTSAAGISRALAPLLESKTVQKVLHASLEDLQVLSDSCGTQINNLFDTQIAAAFAGYGFSISYRNLCKSICAVDLDKGETRSNWLQRPLRDAQMQYAALDVLYLPKMYESLYAELQNQDRVEWVRSECEDCLATARQGIEPAQAYLKVSRAWQLEHESLLCLQQLAQWREELAVERDRPRSWIMKDSALMACARTMPVDQATLAKEVELSPAQTRRYGKQVLEIVEASRVADAEAYPPPLPLPPGKRYTPLSKLLRADVNDCAERLNVAPEVLARKKDLEHLMQTHSDTGSASLPQSLLGWRKDQVGELLQRRVNTHFESS